ncbi:MAG: tRNA lysidine(34) synthetase TilS [Candidatus Goldiibacteriota bacterium HGW-Goldbacteria-1]|nr:MAG: tRNA lysidine(34) synthetase TilS [Candidatus Goldiibacteriota bacterium HGW-Goldbacteria-1]
MFLLSGENIFMKLYSAMLKEITKFIRPNDAIVIGVSGGPDSMALFNLLNSIAKKYNLKIIAAHFNHMLRGKESTRDMEFVRKQAVKAGNVFVTRSKNIDALNKKTGFGTEKTAREERYRFFIESALEYKASKIALAHNLDDNAETILFRLIKGTGTKGLCGIPAQRKVKDGEFGIKHNNLSGAGITIIRPVLKFSKKQIISYLKERKQKYITDSSNSKSVYQRNIIRNKLIPFIEKEMNPAVKECLVRNAVIAANEEDFMQAQADGFIQKNALIDSNKAVFSRVKFLSLHTAVRQRVIMAVLYRVLDAKRKVDYTLVADAEKSIAENSGMSLPAGFAIRYENENVIIKKGDKTPGNNDKAVIIQKNGLKTAYGGFVFETRIVNNNKGINLKGKNSAYVDLSKITFPLTIRKRRNGDKFTPYGMNSQVKIKDFIISQKIKEDIILVCDKKKIIWVAGKRTDDRAKVDKGSKKLLLLRFFPLK